MPSDSSCWPWYRVEPQAIRRERSHVEVVVQCNGCALQSIWSIVIHAKARPALCPVPRPARGRATRPHCVVHRAEHEHGSAVTCQHKSTGLHSHLQVRGGGRGRDHTKALVERGVHKSRYFIYIEGGISMSVTVPFWGCIVPGPGCAAICAGFCHLGCAVCWFWPDLFGSVRQDPTLWD